jgi:hypothetical protein
LAGKEICVPARRHPDRLTESGLRLSQIKFIILEIVIFISFLFWLWDEVKRDFNMSVSPPPAHAAETHHPCRTTLPVGLLKFD